MRPFQQTNILRCVNLQTRLDRAKILKESFALVNKKIAWTSVQIDPKQSTSERDPGSKSSPIYPTNSLAARAEHNNVVMETTTVALPFLIFLAPDPQNVENKTIY